MSKIFVGGISQETTELDLYQYFSEFGCINSTRIVYDLRTKSSKGFGFIEVHDKQTFNSILNFNRHLIKGRIVDINRAIEQYEETPTEVIEKRSKKLYFRGVKPTTTENDLYGYFSTFGEVVKVYLIFNPHSGKSKCFGYVEFCSLETAQIVHQYADHKIAGKKICIERHKNTNLQPANNGLAINTKHSGRSQKSPLRAATKAADKLKRLSKKEKKRLRKEKEVDLNKPQNLQNGYDFLSPPKPTQDGQGSGKLQNVCSSQGALMNHLGFKSIADIVTDSSLLTIQIQQRKKSNLYEVDPQRDASRPYGIFYQHLQRLDCYHIESEDTSNYRFNRERKINRTRRVMLSHKPLLCYTTSKNLHSYRGVIQRGENELSI